MPVSDATNATNKYRAKAYELLSLAECAGDPERRADLLRFARMWMSLTEGIEDLPLPKLPKYSQTIFVRSQRLQYSVQCRNYSDGARASGWVAVTCRPLPETVPLHGLFWMQRFGKAFTLVERPRKVLSGGIILDKFRKGLELDC
jgi:hypothetical protein